MRKFFQDRKRRIVLIVILTFFVAAALELFVAAGFRPAYLHGENYPQPQTQAFTLNDFTLEGASRDGDTVTTTTADGYMVKKTPLGMPVTDIKIGLGEEAARKTRMMVYYTTEPGQEIDGELSVQYYIFPGDTGAKIPMKDTQLDAVRIDFSDEVGVSLDIRDVAFEYIQPLEQVKQDFSIPGLLMFWAIMVLIPVALMNINKL